jgi:hypothetical protein
MGSALLGNCWFKVERCPHFPVACCGCATHTITCDGQMEERHTQSAPSPACGEGWGGGERAHVHRVAFPLPVPPPHAQGNRMWAFVSYCQ